MFEALWPGGGILLVGLMIVVAGIVAWRRRSFQQLQDEFMLGNEDTGILIDAQRPGWEPLPPVADEPTVTILHKAMNGQERLPLQEWLDNLQTLPAPARTPLAYEEATAERLATVDQRLDAQYERIRREQREAWDAMLERHRCEWRTLVAQFENDMEWNHLVDHGTVLENARYS